MALVGTPNERGQTLIINGIDNPGAGQVCLELDDVQKYNEFAIMCTAGQMEVVASLDGVNFSNSFIAWEDESESNPGNNRETNLTANNVYRHLGNFKSIRVFDVIGGVTNPVLMCGTGGRR